MKGCLPFIIEQMTRHIRTYISGIAICIFCLYLFYASRYGSAIFVVTISCGILLLMLLALCIRKRAYCFKYTDLLFVLFFAVYAVYAVVIDRTPFSSERAIGWISAGMLYGCVRLWGRERLVCGVLFGFAIVQGIYGTLQWGGVLPLRNPFFPATGSFFNPALLALCLTVGWFAGGRLLRETKRKAVQGVLGGVLPGRAGKAGVAAGGKGMATNRQRKRGDGKT